MWQTALNSSSNSCCCYIWICQSDQEKKKKINQTPSNWQSQIQSWTCWFQRPIREAFSPNDRSKSNYWRGRCLCAELKAFNSLLPSYEGRDCYSRKIVETSMQRRQNANISKPLKDWKKITESTKPRGRLLGHNLWFRLTVILGWYVLDCRTDLGLTVRTPCRLFIGPIG